MVRFVVVRGALLPRTCSTRRRIPRDPEAQNSHYVCTIRDPGKQCTSERDPGSEKTRRSGSELRGVSDGAREPWAMRQRVSSAVTLIPMIYVRERSHSGS